MAVNIPSIQIPYILSKFASLFMAVIFCLGLSGCSSYQQDVSKVTRRITQKFKISKGRYKKKVGFTPFGNKTVLDASDFQSIFEANFNQVIMGDCPKNIIIQSESDNYPDFLRQLPLRSSGQIDNFKLAQQSRLMGLNAVVIGGLDDISGRKELKGILWYRDTLAYLQIQATVIIYTSETGAKLLDRSIIREIEVDETDLDQLKKGRLQLTEELTEAMTKVAREMGQEICYVLSSQPWRGYVTAVNSDKVTLSSGQRVGLKVGHYLEVYDSSEIVSGGDGDQFFMPGSNIGRIKIEIVYPETAEGIIIEDNGISIGSSVMIK